MTRSRPIVSTLVAVVAVLVLASLPAPAGAADTDLGTQLNQAQLKLKRANDKLKKQNAAIKALKKQFDAKQKKLKKTQETLKRTVLGWRGAKRKLAKARRTNVVLIRQQRAQTRLIAKGARSLAAAIRQVRAVLSDDKGTVLQRAKKAQSRMDAAKKTVGGSGTLTSRLKALKIAVGGSGPVADRVSTLSGRVGGSGSLTERVGEPVTGTTGLAGLVRGGGAAIGTINGFDAGAFDVATSLNAQIAAFNGVLNQSLTVATSQIAIPKGGSYTSMRSALAAVGHD